MSADSFHHQIEKEVKQMKNVYDSPDFFESVASRKGLSVTLNEGDFLQRENRVSLSKVTEGKPVLADVECVRFSKGSLKMFWKTSLAQDDFKPASFLKKTSEQKLSRSLFPNPRINPRGISFSMKKEILLKLVPLMPQIILGKSICE